MSSSRFSGFRGAATAAGLSCVLAATTANATVPIPEVSPSRALAVAQAMSLLPTRNPLRVPRGPVAESAAPGRPAAETPSAPQATAWTGKPPPLPERAPAPPRPAFDYDTALRPLLDYRLSKSDADNLKEAFRAAYAGRSPAALTAARAIKDPSARKLADWYYMRSGRTIADADAIEAFRLANPGWPNPDLLRRRAEESLFAGDDAKRTLAFFKDSAPVSPAGKAALAGAHLASGDKAKALLLLRAAWIDTGLDDSLEAEILDRHGELLTPDDHKARIDKLLFQDRAANIPPALRVAERLGAAEKAKVEARAAVIRRARGADKLLDALPEAAKAETGVLFSRIQWLRRNGRDEEARELLQAAPQEAAVLLDLDEWWVERRIHTRMALNGGDYEVAYEIARNRGPLSGESYLDAEFLAGWIALRFLDRAEDARQHFFALRAAAAGAKSISRAEYWLGRAEDALGNAEEARAHYRNAAQYPFEYYGQLGAHAALRTPKAVTLEVQPTPHPTEQDVERHLARDAVRAIGILRAADLSNLTPLFFFELARTLNSPAEVAMLAELARRMGMMQVSLRLSRIAVNRGVSVVDYAFPIDVLPRYNPLNDGVESALLHALARQESEFNAAARSPAGAQGLLQLMPRTARNVARQYKVRYTQARLVSEPAFNMALGAAHLRDLVDEFGGSYAMALGAYNAGGPRVNEWVQRFGDPRHGKTDVIDWVERVPFTETREYIQKILESVQVFRARLTGSEEALQLLADLNRGKAQGSSETAAIDR